MQDARPDPPAADSPGGVLREHLAWQLDGGYARTSLRAAVDGIAPQDWGRVPGGAAHSVWQIVRHVEICLTDLLEYTRTPGHVSPDFPEGLWPEETAPPSGAEIDRSLAAIDAARAAFRDLVRTADLIAPLGHAGGRCVLRQVLIAVDHESYHVGQITLTRAALGV